MGTSGTNGSGNTGAAPTTVRETERKYESAQPLGPELVGELAAALGGEAPPAHTRAELSATYYDTDDLRLLRSRMTLRRRRGGHDAGWHLKLPAGGDSRDEVRQPLGRHRKPPAPLVALSRAAHRDAPLRPVVELDTVREEWTLTDEGGAPVATVTDDRVTARHLDGGAGRGGERGTGVDTEPLQWAEIEVELAGEGTPEVLDRIEEALLAAGVRRSASASKLGRVLADRVPPAPPRLVAGPDATAGEVVLAYLTEQADTIRATDPAVRRDAAEGVHDMRVACRRMRSTFQSFRALLDRERTDDLVTELRWFAGELGAARDLEVQEARITADVAALPPEYAMGPVAAQTARFFATRRSSAGETATAALDSARYVALLDAIDALLADPPLTEEAGEPAVEVLPRLIDKAVQHTHRALRAAHSHPPGHERDLELHEMRKKGKRLRYAAEVSRPALGKKAKRLVTAVKDLQELLGEHQDSYVARDLLRELGAAAAAEGGNGFAFGWLLRDEQARAEGIEGDVDVAWKAVRKRAKAVTG